MKTEAVIYTLCIITLQIRHSLTYCYHGERNCRLYGEYCQKFTCYNITNLPDDVISIRNNVRTILEIQNSNLRSLPKLSFSKIPNLNALLLEGVGVEEIEPGAFTFLHDLQKLSLSRNKLSNITDLVFYNLKNLNLSMNFFTSVPILNALTNLQHLNLSNNRILSLGSNDFENLNKLDTLDLQNNSIITLHRSCFSMLKNLRHLDLSDNNIYRFQYGLFDSLTSLSYLNISYNHLKEFRPYSYSFLNSLEELYLNHNSIKSIDEHELKEHLYRLRTISLDENKWSCENIMEIIFHLKSQGANVIKGQAFNQTNIIGIACTESDEQLDSNVETETEPQAIFNRVQVIQKPLYKEKTGEEHFLSFSETNSYVPENTSLPPTLNTFNETEKPTTNKSNLTEKEIIRHNMNKENSDISVNINTRLLVTIVILLFCTLIAYLYVNVIKNLDFRIKPKNEEVELL